MVAVGAFPIAKLGALLIKQISKPIANALKTQAKNSLFFRTYVCMPPARFYNWCEIKAKMWVLNFGKPVNITVLNDEMAIELGANLLGESVIFIIASAILIAEYNRSSKKEAAKEEAKRREIETLQQTITELYIQTEEQSAHIRELTRKFGDLESRVLQKPWVPKKDEDSKEKKRDPPPRSPPQTERLRSFSSNELPPPVENVGMMRKAEPPRGFVLRAVGQIESELWSSRDDKREDGVITSALNHLYRDVYRVPLRFY